MTQSELTTAALVNRYGPTNPDAAPPLDGEMYSVLLPCPFCGMDGLWRVKEDDRDEGWVQCSVCKARGPVGRPHQLAIYYWNKRRSPNTKLSND